MTKRQWKREAIGEPYSYLGHVVVVRCCGPDLLCEVGDIQLANFFLTPEAARQAAMKYIDGVEKEKTEKLAKKGKR